MLRDSGTKSPRKKTGRPRKKRPGQPGREVSTEAVSTTGQAYERLAAFIKRENKVWVWQQATKHWSSNGQVLDDILDCLRLGLPVEIKTYTPKFVIKAKQAELKRRDRVEKLSKKERVKAAPPPDEGPTNDAGSDKIDV